MVMKMKAQKKRRRRISEYKDRTSLQTFFLATLVLKRVKNKGIIGKPKEKKCVSKLIYPVF